MPRAVVIIISWSLLASACATSLDLVVDGATPATPTVVEVPTAAPEPTTALRDEPSPTPAPEPTATADPEPTPTPLPPGRISVTDTDAVGILGDDRISLVEAVRLANSRLTVGELSAAEAALVQGSPGATNADTITVSLPDPAVITFPGGDVWIVELFNNHGDSLIGRGAVLTGALGPSHNILLVGSSNVLITGFVFDEVTNAIAVESGGNALAGILIEGNEFRNTVVDGIHVRNSLSEGSISDIRITANRFEATSPASGAASFVAVRAGFGQFEDPVAGARVNGVEISGNTMLAPGGTIPRCISLAAAHVIFGRPSKIERSALSELTVAGNTLVGCVTAVAVVGALVDQTNATVADNTVTDVVVEANTITDAQVAITVHGARVASVTTAPDESESTAASLTGNRVVTVSLTGNTLARVGTGLRVVGGEFAVAGGGSAERNSVSGISGDTLSRATIGPACEVVADVGERARANAVAPVCDALSG